MKSKILIACAAILLFLSCQYEFSYGGELGKGILPRGSENAFRVSFVVREDENLLLAQIPHEDESVYEGPVHAFRLDTGEHLGPYADSEGRDVRAGEIFSLSGGGWAAVGGNPDPFDPQIRLTLYGTGGEVLSRSSLALPPFTEGNENEWYHAFALNDRGDLTALYGWSRGRPGGIIRISDFAGGNRGAAFIDKEQFREALTLSPDGPFAFRNLRYGNGFYYAPVDMKPDPYDGVLILDGDLNPVSYNTGNWLFNCPWDAAADEEGHIYASNFYHDTVKIYNSEGILARTARDDMDGYEEQYMNNPGDIALAGKTLYVYDSGNGRIVRFSSLVREPAGLANPSQLIIPYRLAAESRLLYLSFLVIGALLIISLNSFTFAIALKDRSMCYLGIFYFTNTASFINSEFSRFFIDFPNWNIFSPLLMMLAFIRFMDYYLDKDFLPPWYGKTRRTYLITFAILYFLYLLAGIIGDRGIKDIVYPLGDIVSVSLLVPLALFFILQTAKGDRKCRDLLVFFGLILLFGLISPGIFTGLSRKLNLIYPPLLYNSLPLQLGFTLGGFFLTYLIISRLMESRTASARERERRRQLEELDKKKTRWVMNMSHELRTPLTLIMGIAEQLKEGRWGDSIQKNRPHFDAIDRNSALLLGQINDFLALSRFEQKERRANLHSIDLGRFTELIASDYASLAESRGITFQWKASESGILHADPELAKTALDNILGNAFKFTPSGGAVSLSAEETPEGVIFIVSDTGPGVAPEDRERIFTPFEQADTSNISGGMGLGLALVKEIMDLHGGRVSLSSSRGAAFSLLFPKASGELPLWAGGQSACGRGETVIPASSGAGEYHILIAEDNRELMAYLLSELSPYFRLTSASDGIEALEKAGEDPPDLIISDIMMPRMDGHALFDKLGENRPPFLFLTARANGDEKLDALGKGAVDYMEKPFSPGELILKVKGILDRSKKEREDYKRDFKKDLIRFLDNYDQLATTDHSPLIKMTASGPDLSSLTPREREIYDYIVQGLSDKEISGELNISIKTVGNHNSSLFRKLNVTGRRELILRNKN